ncbi:hypothetical protein J2Z21_002988 [Streptomyces griseochromogenes]|uniref:Uncharacterized protein n=1 Tax=Streptomyces griseochromogenes TaxID=68214 RepID=A0A1B1AXG3_9ACTN|nr:hypothetical protein [Streptomyces griseochromogenes]ANP51263.1 hypothetical protein AVL59_17990 [Streptomyces griseochromogenes]MBP2050052.1 hypothetical protein [Streptomyces griseochromogenes]
MTLAPTGSPVGGTPRRDAVDTARCSPGRPDGTRPGPALSGPLRQCHGPAATRVRPLPTS